MSHKGADYTKNFLNNDNLKTAVKEACQFLKKVDFSHIAFRGMSGAVFATPVAMKLNKKLILVRKHEDESHATRMVDTWVEGDYDDSPFKYVIIDDFTSTGSTNRHIMKEIKLVAPKAKCLGMLPMRGFLKELSYCRDFGGPKPKLLELNSNGEKI